MKFEDLFKQKAPTNYVEKASQQVDPLQAFFAERTAPVAKAQTPISQQKKEAIKSQFSLKPKVSEQETMQEDSQYLPEAQQFTEQATSEQDMQQATKKAPLLTIPDLAESSVEQTIEKRKPSSISDEAEAQLPERDWTSFLPYLTPLLVGALSGGSYGTSSEIAGSALLKGEEDRLKRKQTLEDKLLELEKTRLSKKSKNLDLKEVDIDGKPIFFSEEQAIGKQAWKQAGTDAESGRQARFEASQLQKQLQKKKDIEIQAGSRFQQKLEQDKVFQDYKQQATQSQRALELLSKGLGVADAGARTTFAKGIFGEVGNLAVQEQVAVSGSPMIYQKYESLWKKYSEGTLGDQDRADMIEVALAIKQNSPKVLNKIAMERATAEKAISGINVDRIAQSLSRDNATGDIFIKVVHKGRVKQISINDFPRAVREEKAQLYTGKK